MALVVKDRVKETTTSTGTGTIELAGAVGGFQTFVAGVGSTNTTYYAIEDANGTAWEVGLGTVTDASPDTLARTTILANSNGDTSAITLSSGTHTVFATYPAGKAVYLDASGNLSHTVDLTSEVTGTLPVGNGGTGATTLTDGGILLGSGTGAVTAMSVLGDGVIVVGDNSTDPTTITAFTASDGVLKHEVGGLELDISAIAIGDVIAGTGTGSVGIVTSTGHSDGDVLTIQADGTVDWETPSSGGASNIAGLSDALVENDSIYLGNDPSSTTSTAERNIVIGTTALDAVTTSDDNIAIGYNTGTAITGGLSSMLQSSKNVLIGSYAGENLTTGSDKNVFIGYEAGHGLTDSHSGSVVIGHHAGYSATDDRANYLKNVHIGFQAGMEANNQYAVHIGPQAGEYNAGNGSVAIGDAALKGTSGTPIDTYQSVAIGENSGSTSTGDYCVYLGRRAGYANTSDKMLFIGWDTPANSETIIKADMDNKHVAVGVADSLTVSAGSPTFQVYTQDAADPAFYAKMAGSHSGNLIQIQNSSGSDIFVVDSSGEITTGSISGSGEANEDSFKTISVSGQDDVVADTTTDTLTLAAGSNVTITTTAASDTVTIAATDTNTTYTAGDGLGLSGTEFSADLKANGGLVIESAEIAVDLSASSITGTLAIGDGGTGATSASAARTALGVDAAGTDNSTDVTLVTSSHDYLSISTQAITLGAIDLTADVTGTLPVANGGTGATTLNNLITLGTHTTGNYVATIAGTSNEIEVSGSGSETATITIGLPDDVTIAGDLTVNGDTVTVNTATLSVEDPLIILASGNNAADSVDIGFYGLYDTSGSQDLYAGLFRDANDSGKFKLFKDLQAAPTTTVNTSGTGYAVATLVANIEGDVTGDVTGNVSGTAATVTGATQAAITSAANLATVGTITTGVWQATDVAVAHGGTGASTAADARTNLGVDAAGTDNSTNVTLVTTSHDYLSISTQAITLGAIDLTADVTGTLPVANGGTGLTSIATLLNSNNNIFKTISVSGQDDVVADSATDTLTLAAGSNVTITTTAGTDTITIAATDTNTMGSGFTVSATTDSNATTITQGDDLMFAAGTGITCETTADGTVTISSTVTDTNTTYSAGTLLDLSSTTFNVDLSEASAAVMAEADEFIFLDNDDSSAAKRESLSDLLDTIAGTVGTTGLDRSGATLVVSDLHPVGVSGSANQLLTDDGDGTVTSEANFTFTGSAATLIGTLTVGVDDTGHDVKFFGATSGSYMLWDEDADDLIVRVGDIIVQDASGNTEIAMDSSGTLVLGTNGDRQIRVDNESGTNTAGKHLDMRAGKSTGTGAGGSIKMYTGTTGGGSGSGSNAHAIALTLDENQTAQVEAGVYIKEAAAANADTAAYGQIWVKTATPNELYFTNDAGNDIQITSGTSLAGGSIDGSGAAGYLAYWSDSDTLTYDNNQLFWDASSNELGVGTATPGSTLDISGSVGYKPFTIAEDTGEGDTSWDDIGANTYEIGSAVTYLVETGDTNRTIELPDPSSSIAGRTYTIKKIDSGTGTVTIQPYDAASAPAGGYIDGDNATVDDGTNILWVQYDTISATCAEGTTDDRYEWHIVQEKVHAHTAKIRMEGNSGNIAHDTDTAIAYDTLDWAIGCGTTITGSDRKITINRKGKYSVKVQLRLNNTFDSGERADIKLYKNGTHINTGSTIYSPATNKYVYGWLDNSFELDVDDYLTVKINHWQGENAQIFNKHYDSSTTAFDPILVVEEIK